MMVNLDNHKIKFHFLIKPPTFTQRNLLKRSLINLFKAEGKRLGSLTYVFCSDEYLLELNRNFLHHNYYTDIITFELSDNKDVVVGEIFVSIDRVRENARNLHESLGKELRRVIFHGALHLCGYNDKKKKDVVVMRNKEEEYLTIYYKNI